MHEHTVMRDEFAGFELDDGSERFGASLGLRVLGTASFRLYEWRFVGLWESWVVGVLGRRRFKAVGAGLFWVVRVRALGCTSFTYETLF